MKVFILMGSPRLKGNTATLCVPFRDELEKCGAEVRYVELARKNIRPCLSCFHCQNVNGVYGCIQQDDMTALAEDILWADTIILATPIYAWYCTAEMKAVLDRHYGFNKYYGSAEGNLWQGRKVGIIATHGYPADYACGPFEQGIARLCKHSKLEYIGLYSVRDVDEPDVFHSPKAVEGARAFARRVCGILKAETATP